MERLKKFENYSDGSDDEVILVMLNDQPIGVVKDNNNIKYSVHECINEEGYDEVEFGDDLQIVDTVANTSGNRCKVDGSRVNLHLIRMRVFE